MPRILLFSALLLLLLGAVRSEVSPTKPARAAAGLDEVVLALRAGNAQELGKYIDENVEISLPEKSDSYARAQGILVLKDFFANNIVTGFDVQFKGENGGSQFCVGKLVTRSGSYRTTVFMKTRSGKQSIKELRFVAM